MATIPNGADTGADQHARRATPSFAVAWMPAPARALYVILWATSLATVVVLAAIQLLPFIPELTPPRLVRALLFLAVIPAAAATALRIGLSGTIRGTRDSWTLERRWGSPIPLTLSAAKPWRWPVPGPGLRLESASTGWSLQCDQAAQVLRECAPEATCSPVIERARPSFWAYAEARADFAPSRLGRAWAKFGVFGAFPVFIAFRLHQWVMYGGLLGQYYMYGLGAYVSTLVFYWVLVTAYLVLFAAALRFVGEAIALAVTAALPGRAVAIRGNVERTLLVAYYAGVPLWMAWRFFLA